MFQKSLVAVLCALSLGIVVSSASATNFNFATGQDVHGGIQTNGDSLDANWTQVGATSPLNGSNTYVVGPNTSDWYGQWLANSSTSSWIAPNPDNSRGNGNFTVSYSFDLTGYQLGTASFSNTAWTIDDTGFVSLNGHQLSSISNDNWSSLHAFSIDTADLNQGINTLTITSNNSDVFLEAVRFEGMLSIDPNTNNVPEPGVLALCGISLLGLVFARRKHA